MWGLDPGSEGAGLYLEHARSHGDDLAEVHDVRNFSCMSHRKSMEDWEDAAQRWPSQLPCPGMGRGPRECG